jgi:putative hemolysin
MALTAIIVCLIFDFFVTLVETALLASRPSRLDAFAEKLRESDPQINPDNLATRVESVKVIIDDSQRLVAFTRTGFVLSTLLASSLLFSFFAYSFTSFLLRSHAPHPFAISTAILFVALSGVVLLFGGMLPRSIGEQNAEKIALNCIGAFRALQIVETPLVWIIAKLSGMVLRLLGLSANYSSPAMTEEELNTFLETSHEEGVIEQEEKEMLRNVISFGDTLVHEVMTPRIDIKSVDVNTPVGKLVNLIVDCGHSRIPICEGTVDKIVGIIHAKDLLPSLATGGMNVTVKSLMRRIGLVPENKRVDELLEEFRRSKSQIAIVQDEYGGTAGLVTVEDLLEEIVGEIQDEYDVEQPKIKHAENGAAEVDARLRIDEVNEELGLDLESDDFDTIGGFVFGLFGHMPTQGESIEYEKWTFTISEADGRRVYRLAICERSETETPDSASEAEQNHAAA